MAEMILVAVLGILLGIAVGACARSKSKKRPPMPSRVPRPPIEPLGSMESEKRRRA